MAKDQEAASARPWTLWGWSPAWRGVTMPVAVTAGSLKTVRAEQKRREREGMLCGVYASTDAPTGLRLQVAERLTPAGSVAVLERPAPEMDGSVPCTTCGGTGYTESGGLRYVCSTCGGTGRIQF